MSADFPIFSQSLGDWLSYLENIHYKTIDLGLERMVKVANALKLISNPPKGQVITVTGTNGKGSVTNLLGKFLRSKGYVVNIYNSPHLIKFNERITLNNSLASDEELLNVFRDIETTRRTLNVSLTFFEFTTLAAFLLFREHPADFVILEVGMGGRFDSVNILDAQVSVITNVALDHTSFLGLDREEIGYQKVGIVKENSTLIYGENDIPISVVDWTKKVHANLVQSKSGVRYNLPKDNEKYWSFVTKQETLLTNLPIPSIPIANVSTVLCTLEALDLSFDGQEVSDAISTFRMPGRFQIIKSNPTVVVDVGHNPHAFAFLKRKLDSLKNNHPNCKVLGVIGMLRDKDFSKALNIIANELDGINICSLSGPRGTKSSELASELDSTKLEIKEFADPIVAYNDALKNSSSNDIILIAGSFLTAGAVLEHCFKDYQDFLKSYS